MPKPIHIAIAVAAVLFAAAAVGPDALLAAKKKAKKKGSKGHPTYVFVDSTFAPEGTNRMMVNFTNTSGDVDALDKFYPLFADAMRDRAEFILVDGAQVAAEAHKKGLAAEREALARRWKQERQVDPDMLQHFSSELGLAYYLEGELTEWHSEEVDWNVEGYSHSEVKVRISIFSGQTGKLVYEAHDRVELRSQYHDPRAQTGVVDDLGIQRGGSHIVPPAPPIERAAEQVAANLVSEIP